MRTIACGMLAACLLAGCASEKKETPKVAAPKPQPLPAAVTTGDDADLKAARAALSPEDRKLVEMQEFCAINTTEHLGEMGAPVKVEIKGQTVFLCCKSCQKQALADPDKTLAAVATLKKQVAAAKKPAS